MSSIDDRYIRLQALERALKWTSKDWVGTPDDLMDLAENFRAFLAGEGAKPEPFNTEVWPTLKLPVEHDGYLYWRHRDTHILYRSRTDDGARVQAVERLNAVTGKSWRPATGTLATRAGMWNADGYHVIGTAKAREIIQEHVKDVRFE